MRRKVHRQENDLPGKTNKQVRDKRAETTYRRQLRELLDQGQAPTQREDLQGSKEESIANLQEPQQLGRGEEEQEGDVCLPQIPSITVTDHGDYITGRERVWQEDIIRIATLIQPPKDAPRGTADIMRTLRDTLQYVSDCDGRIPTTHLDHVYEQVLEYIHTNSKGKRAQEGPRNRPQKNKEPKRSYKIYIYSRTQDLFKNNPGS